MLWHIELKFCIRLSFTVLQIKLEFRQFASIFVGVMPLLERRILEIHSFPHFSLTSFDILSWKLAYYFILLQFLLELCLFVNLEYLKYSYMLWLIDLKFCVSLYFYARKIKFECHQFPSLFAGVMLLFNFKFLQICSFPHFSPTCLVILSSNFAYDFVLMYHRASLSVVILLQFLLELCLFVNLEYLKYTVFRTFLLHALIYWAEILHMTLFYCTSDQVRVSSICVNFCGSYAPFGT